VWRDFGDRAKAFDLDTLDGVVQRLLSARHRRTPETRATLICASCDAFSNLRWRRPPATVAPAGGNGLRRTANLPWELPVEWVRDSANYRPAQEAVFARWRPRSAHPEPSRARGR
jgi:hypothetical protein